MDLCPAVPPCGAVGEVLGVGLQQGPGEQRLRLGEKCCVLSPEFVEHLLPTHALCGAQGRGRLRKGARSDVLDEGEELCEPGEEDQQRELVAQRARRTRRPRCLRSALPGDEVAVERFLEARDVLVEAQPLSGERMSYGELTGALDPLVPLRE